MWTNTHLAYSPRLQNSALVVLRETVVISRAALVFADSLMATAAPMSGRTLIGSEPTKLKVCDIAHSVSIKPDCQGGSAHADDRGRSGPVDFGRR